ncbi:MAG: nuclear transport factor 2 family protein [Rikenellaceae bacterium]
MAECDLKKVVMIEPMVKFMKGDMAQGMMKHFADVFQGAMDTRTVEVKKRIPQVGSQKWAGVEFDFTKGAVSDFPASSINIGGKVYYTHFAPNKKHLSPLQITNREAVDATLSDLTEAKESGCELFIGSHGEVASIEDVEFLISYLERVKVLLAECEDSDTFGQRLISSYPHLEGYLNVRGVAQNLYPNETKCEEKEVLKGRMQDYLNMISTQDMNIAKGLWVDKKSISLIGARSHYFGFDEIMNFVVNAFSDIPKLEMSSTSEVVNIAGNMGYVQLYWLWVETDANGATGIERGRETLIFEKINDEWRLVHVHYSPLPKK